MKKFKIVRKDKRTEVEKQIDNLAAKLETMNGSEPEYKAMAENLKTLSEASSFKEKKRLDANVIIPAVLSFLGIAGIVWAESKDVLIRSKALPFCKK